jgi:diacylglycerol kinase (ATP)
VTYTFVLNGLAGRGRLDPVLAAIRESFAVDEVEFVTDPARGGAASAARFASSAASLVERSGEQVLVAVGGDGTVSRILRLAVRTGTPLGLLPAGTANDLARALGIPADPRAACRVLRAGVRRSLDLLAVNGVPFATCGGLGLAADAAATMNRWRRRPGRRGAVARAAGGFVYAAAAARELGRFRRGCEVDLAWEYGRMSAPLLSMFASNVALLGGRYRTAPDARPDDGLLDLCLLPAPRTAVDRARALRAAVAGSVLGIPGARLLQVRRAVLRTDRPALFFGDGEILARGREFRLEVRHRALEVLAPAEPGRLQPREEAA